MANKVFGLENILLDFEERKKNLTAQLEEARGSLARVKQNAMSLTDVNDKAAAFDAWQESVTLESVILRLAEEIETIDTTIAETRKDTQRPDLEKKLIDLGKQVQKERAEFEASWRALERDLQKAGAELASKYTRWHESSVKAAELLRELEPGTRSRVAEGPRGQMFSERARAFQEHLLSQGVDITNFTHWDDIRDLHYKGGLPVLDSPILGALDIVLEGGLYGRELSDFEAMSFGARRSRGAMYKALHAKAKRRHFYPVIPRGHFSRRQFDYNGG